MAVNLEYKNVSQECEKNWRFLRYQFQKCSHGKCQV